MTGDSNILEMAASTVQALPATALSRINQFLDAPDVVSFAHTCSFLYSSVTQDGPLWKRHCRHDFVCDEVLGEGVRSWYEQWLYLCREFGQYRSCYAQVKSAWKQIESLLQERCPQAYSELMASGAVSEAELKELEGRLGIQLPEDYRCSLRLHGKLSVPLGSVSYLVQTYRRRSVETRVNHQTFKLHGASDVRFETIPVDRWPELRIGFLAIGENISSIPTKSPLGSYSESAKEFLAMVSSDEGSTHADCPFGHVFTAFSSRIRYGYGQPGGCCVDLNRLYEWLRIPEFGAFADWLSAEADRLQHYYISAKEKQLTRFVLKPGSEAVTGYFTVRVATAILCEAGGWRNSCSVALCLIVELSKDASVEDSCQLVQDCLVVNSERVDPQYCSFVQTPPPITLHPGDVVEYLSQPLQDGYLNQLRRAKVDEALEGYVIMQTVQGSREVRLNLPPVTLETVTAQRFGKVKKRERTALY